ncbi:MAG TPA: hypothetical protein VGD67_15905 [Pseudonocardiaceae bacterium]
MPTRPGRPAARALPSVLAALAVLTVLAGCGAEPAGSSSTPRPTAQATAPPSTGGGPAPTSAAAGQQVISVLVSGGQVSPAPGPVDAALGSTVVIEVTSDVADELHVHGYDRTAALAAGEPGRLELELTIPGQFEVELHGEHLLLFTLRVS